MSEELNTEVAAPEAATTEQTTTTAATEQTTEAPAKTETTEAPKYDYVPAKFLKADGTPDFEKLAKSYTGLEKKLGSKPNIPASSVEEYEFDFGDMVDPNDEGLQTFKSEALAKGFTKDQYQFAMQAFKNYTEGMTSVFSVEKTEAALKAEWGKDYDTQLKAVKAGFEEFAPSDANPNDPVWNHPAVMKLLARIGSEVGEDSVAGKQGGKAAPAMTEAEVAEIMRSAAYRAGDRDLHAKVTAWYQKNRG